MPVLAKQAAAQKIPSPEEIIARTRAMIPGLIKRAPIGERDRRLPKETIAEMQAAGLFKVLQPKRWGGYEMDTGTYYEVQMALGEGDMSVAWVYGVVGVHPWFVAQLDERAEQEIWGQDNSTLICSSLMPVGTAKPVEGGFRISGRWKYASGSDHCEWAFLGGAVEGRPDDRRIFVVPRKDYEIIDTWHVPGLKATGYIRSPLRGGYPADNKRSPPIFVGSAGFRDSICKPRPLVAALDCRPEAYPTD